jgi:periplasmic protein TonB
MLFGGWGTGAAPDNSPAGALPSISVTAIEVPLEVLAAERTDPAMTAEVPAPVVRPWDAPPGDRDKPVAVTVAPRNADGKSPRSPAPDQGSTGGQPADNAFRRDRTALRARLTDGAKESQLPRLRTSRRPASPQAVRREPNVGIGDSVRTVAPARAPDPSPPRANTTLALGGEPAGASSTDAPEARATPPIAATRLAVDPVADSQQGPLDAEQGSRAFDTEQRGRAADDRSLRAASNEPSPGLTDFSRPSVHAPMATPQGRGPGAAPGAVARASTGAAPDAFGARDPRVFGPDLNERTLDRRYDRYKKEIEQRVNRMREFPKALALRLEQGETIVKFVVGTDGRIGEGPQIVKSSGFEEFDSAAMRAVQRAAPFPPMPNPGQARPLPVSLRVTFDNPVVR